MATTGLPGDVCARIIGALHLPRLDWQIGKTRVFMRGSIHEPLEEQRTALLNQSATAIQKRWRGLVCRREYVKQRRAAVRIQLHFRGHRQHLAYLRMRRAAVTIQAYVRGMFSREVARAMRQMKRLEEEKREKEREEQERRRLEEERRARESEQQQHEQQRRLCDAIDEKQQNESLDKVAPGPGTDSITSGSMTSLPQSDDSRNTQIYDSVL